MKFISISSVIKTFFKWPLLLAILLVIANGCTKSPSEQEQKADVKAIIQQVFLNKWLSRFLTNPGPKPFVFHYEELPTYNGHSLPKPTFNIKIINQITIAYSVDTKDEWTAIPILIEQVIINHDSATVNLRIPKQGVVGQFRLGKTAAGSWVVTKDNVVEI